jgi:hypothetical protein
MRAITLEEFERLPGPGRPAAYRRFVEQLKVNEPYVFDEAELPPKMQGASSSAIFALLDRSVLQVHGRDARLTIRHLPTGELVLAIVKKTP